MALGNSDGFGKQLANMINNDLKALLKKYKLTIEECPLKPEVIGFLARQVANGLLTKAKAKEFMTKWFNDNVRKEEE